jgi:hypothetical protein
LAASPAGERKQRPAVSRPQGWISATLVVSGRIEGTWEPGRVITPFRKLPASVVRALPDGTTIL